MQRFVSLTSFALCLGLTSLACGAASDLTKAPIEEATSLDDHETSEPASSGLFFDLDGIEEIEILTPTEGVGLKPLFEWRPVTGATNYLLVLQDALEQTYWTWRGSSTSIYLGGVATAPPEDAAGPVLQTDMTWAVVALDAGDNVIASSRLRSISP
ncbi:MAG: hypothetical protein HND51_12015 [Chloroflexi bacterium]|nr:hypothetical protein [Chloroflexota bacterium]